MGHIFQRLWPISPQLSLELRLPNSFTGTYLVATGNYGGIIGAVAMVRSLAHVYSHVPRFGRVNKTMTDPASLVLGLPPGKPACRP